MFPLRSGPPRRRVLGADKRGSTVTWRLRAGKNRVFDTPPGHAQPPPAQPPSPTQTLPKYRGRSRECEWWGLRPHHADVPHPSVFLEDLGRAWGSACAGVPHPLVYPTLVWPRWQGWGRGRGHSTGSGPSQLRRRLQPPSQVSGTLQPPSQLRLESTDFALFCLKQKYARLLNNPSAIIFAFLQPQNGLQNGPTSLQSPFWIKFGHVLGQF